jgi:hypothetical protein
MIPLRKKTCERKWLEVMKCLNQRGIPVFWAVPDCERESVASMNLNIFQDDKEHITGERRKAKCIKIP